jgi:hypothetical protein
MSTWRRTWARTCSGVPFGSTCWVSQPPPQKVISRPKSRFQRFRVHSPATDLYRIDGVEPGFDQVGQQRPDRAATVEHYLHAGELAGARPHGLMAGLEELPVHARGDLRGVLRPKVIAEHNNVDVRPYRTQKLLEVAKMDFHQRVEEPVDAGRIFRQQHEKAVHAVVELAHFEQIAAEQAEDRPVGGGAQARGAGGEFVQRPDRGAGRRSDARPHVLGIKLFDAGQVFFPIEERPVHLVEVIRAFGHAGDDAAARRAEHPAGALALRQSPHGHFGGGSVGQRPVGPPLVFLAEGAAELDCVHAETRQDVFVDDRQLLHGIVDVDRAGRQAERGAEPRVRHGRNAGRTVP